MKVCAVQLNPKSCKDYNQFYSYLENIFEQAKEQDLNAQKEAILSCFSILAAKYKTNVITGSFYELIEEGM
jgi:hypothetical protein